MEERKTQEDFAQKSKSKGGFSRIWHALKYSYEGLIAAYKHESAFRQETVTFAILLLFVAILPVDWISKVLLILPMPLILCVELLNSSIEAIVDDISREYREQAKLAKDFGSAAVFCMIVFGAITWTAVFTKNILDGAFDPWMNAVRHFFAQ